MTSAPPSSTTRRAVDERVLRRVAERMRGADQAPWLHGEVARRMAGRLGIVKLQPPRVLDWWAHAGAGAPLLAQAYPRAQIVSVERRAPPAAAPPPWWSAKRWRGAGAPALAEADVAPGAAQLVWANMVLHLVPDPLLTLRDWHKALSVEGFLMFSTLGPGSLPELRALYASQHWGPPLAPLVDMHDLGDMLVAAGFADPVMDQEVVTLTWPDAAAAVAELRSLGANADPGRVPGLHTPRWHRRLLEALEGGASQREGGRIGLSFELVYGHAFKPVPRARVALESAVPLEDMRAMVRAGRRS
jgi:malonyl-CoA O-methyltransferase